MNDPLIHRRSAILALGGACLMLVGCRDSTTAAPVDAREGGGTPTLFDNPPLGDPLAPSQADLNKRRPARKPPRPRP